MILSDILPRHVLFNPLSCFCAIWSEQRIKEEVFIFNGGVTFQLKRGRSGCVALNRLLEDRCCPVKISPPLPHRVVSDSNEEEEEGRRKRWGAFSAITERMRRANVTRERERKVSALIR